MTYTLRQTELTFKKPFKLAHGTRFGTTALFLRLTEANTTGYAEATFPPYLYESVAQSKLSVEKAIVKLSSFQFETVSAITRSLDAFALSPFTRALLANALIDLNAKRINSMASKFLNIQATGNAFTTLTVTENDLNDLEEKKAAAQHYSHIKLKLHGKNDISLADSILTHIQKPFCVDVNQGWENKTDAEVEILCLALKERGCVLLEQPFAKEDHLRHGKLKAKNILPVYADEGIQSLEDLLKTGEFYNGINIKLLKAGGLDIALEMAKKAQALNLAVIIGCMSESSCGCATAYTLAPYAQFLDIDGHDLISNDPFTGLSIANGKISVSGNSGFGIEPLPHLFYI